MSANTSTGSVATSETVLTEGEQDILTGIFGAAVDHEQRCVDAYGKVRDLLKLDLNPHPRTMLVDVFALESAINEFDEAIRRLAAAIAPAALSRTRQLASIPLLRDSLAPFDMSDDDAQRFLAPILAEAGIADRYVEEAR